QTLGKGSLWCVDPDYRPNLLQALRKTPFHPYHHVLPYAPHGLQGGPLSHIAYNPANRLPIIQSAYGSDVPLPAHIHLVENLLSGASNYRFSSINAAGVGTDMEVDAAATMMMFRTPPEKRVEQLVKLKREGLQPLHSYTVNNGAAPLQAKPSNRIVRPPWPTWLKQLSVTTNQREPQRPDQLQHSKQSVLHRRTARWTIRTGLSSTMCTPGGDRGPRGRPCGLRDGSDGSMETRTQTRTRRNPRASTTAGSSLKSYPYYTLSTTSTDINDILSFRIGQTWKSIMPAFEAKF
ncbi:FoxN2/3, partial [Apostichopus japonicus]